MELDAELTALATQEDLPADLVRRLLQHPGARRSVALLRQDLTDELIAEIIDLGSVRTLAANSSVPARIRARFAEHPVPSVRCAVAASVRDEPPDLSSGLIDLLAEDPDIFVRNAIASRPGLPPALRERVVATLEPDSPLAEWMLEFSRGTHTCPPAAPAPPPLTRQQAEALLARAGL
ncbi:hypothetical protein ACFWAR_04560 [Streptomyces sp. NPDC059917]|uniref:hypothetical protein n=1 Tax=Streptomyces sp. NPDC059917 TaxID=3347002 RepID=UPI00365612CE